MQVAYGDYLLLSGLGNFFRILPISGNRNIAGILAHFQLLIMNQYLNNLIACYFVDVAQISNMIPLSAFWALFYKFCQLSATLIKHYFIKVRAALLPRSGKQD